MTTLIVGGGWSGLTAAVHLLEQGEHVHLIESAKQLGGRARTVNWQSHQLDNGQHLLLGAYRHTLSLLNKLGAKQAELFEQHPFNLSIYDNDYPTLRLTDKSNLPWPLSLGWQVLKSNGLSVAFQLSRLFYATKTFPQHTDISVESWLNQHDQTARLIKQLWEPLCLAVMNTPITEASAKLFAKTLQDAFSSREHSRLLIAKVPLGGTLPDFAANYIKQQNGQISLQTRATQLLIENNTIQGVMTDQGNTLSADHVILATPSATTNKLLAKHANWSDQGCYPIITVYLICKDKLPLPLIGLSGCHSQWAIQRENDVIAVVISGPGEHEQLSNSTLSKLVINELNTFGIINKTQVEDHWVIREKRATFQAKVNIQNRRPHAETNIKGLWLAGDYIHNHYPATLEGAVINGTEVAKNILSSQNIYSS